MNIEWQKLAKILKNSENFLYICTSLNLISQLGNYFKKYFTSSILPSINRSNTNYFFTTIVCPFYFPFTANILNIAVFILSFGEIKNTKI